MLNLSLLKYVIVNCCRNYINLTAEVVKNDWYQLSEIHKSVKVLKRRKVDVLAFLVYDLVECMYTVSAL